MQRLRVTVNGLCAISNFYFALWAFDHSQWPLVVFHTLIALFCATVASIQVRSL